MNHAGMQALLTGLRGAEPGYPFGPDAQVWKVGGKMFAIVGETAGAIQISLKCDPELALDLRDEFPDHVRPGYHLNKKHWNTVTVDGVPEVEIEDWIGHSYDLVVASLPASLRRHLEDHPPSERSDR